MYSLAAGAVGWLLPAASEAIFPPLIAGARIAGRYNFEQMLESRAFKCIMFDLSCCGGLSQAHRRSRRARLRDGNQTGGVETSRGSSRKHDSMTPGPVSL